MLVLSSVAVTKIDCLRNDFKGRNQLFFQLAPIVSSLQLVEKHNSIAPTLQHKGAHLTVANWEAGSWGEEAGRGQEEQSPFKGRSLALFLQPGPPSSLCLLRDESDLSEPSESSHFTKAGRQLSLLPAPLPEPVEDILYTRDLII